MELTLEQKRAMAMAAARMRMQEPVQAEEPSLSLGETVSDTVKSLGIGVAEGAIGLAGLPGLIQKGAGYLNDMLPENVRMSRDPSMQLPTPDSIQKGIEEYTGEFYKSKSGLGQTARTVGQFLPGAAIGPGGMVTKLAVQGVIPGLASEGAGKLTEGTAAEPYARGGAALLAGLGGARAITPFRVPEERLNQVNVLRNEGIDDITAGQVTGRTSLRNFESERGGRGAENISTNQGEQFTAAALRRANIDAPRATPEVMDQAFTRIGQEFDRLAARNPLQIDNLFAHEMAAVQQEYQLLANPLQRQVVNEAINDVIGVVQRHNGVIPGEVYQTMRSRLDRAARGAGQDIQFRDAMYGIRNTLDEAMERSLNRTNPQDVGAWREVRNDYRNILVLERAASGAGEGAAQGILSPSALRNATTSQHGRRNYVRGDGEFAELARAGEAILKPLPNSGTPGRMSAQMLGTGIPGVVGAIGGVGASGGYEGATPGFLAGAILPHLMGRAAVSRPGRTYLGNQVAAGLDPRPRGSGQAKVRSSLRPKSSG